VVKSCSEYFVAKLRNSLVDSGTKLVIRLCSVELLILLSEKLVIDCSYLAHLLLLYLFPF